MGFSVSGSFAILVVAAFIAFGMAYTAGANGFERVTEATKTTADDDLHRQNTRIDLVRLNYTSQTLTVNVTNNGTTALDVNATDAIVDGDYYSTAAFESVLVDGRADTELWLPGEELSVEIQLPDLTTPARVKVVTEHGVATWGVVS